MTMFEANMDVQPALGLGMDKYGHDTLDLSQLTPEQFGAPEVQNHAYMVKHNDGWILSRSNRIPEDSIVVSFLLDKYISLPDVRVSNAHISLSMIRKEWLSMVHIHFPPEQAEPFIVVELWTETPVSGRRLYMLTSETNIILPKWMMIKARLMRMGLQSDQLQKTHSV